MSALRPINRDEYNRGNKEIEDLRLFMVGQGAYLDIQEPAYPRTRLNALTAGTRVGGMRIKGGTV